MRGQQSDRSCRSPHRTAGRQQRAGRSPPTSCRPGAIAWPGSWRCAAPTTKLLVGVPSPKLAGRSFRPSQLRLPVHPTERALLDAQQLRHAPALLVAIGPFEGFIDGNVCLRHLASSTQALGQCTEIYRMAKTEPCLAKPVESVSKELHASDIALREKQHPLQAAALCVPCRQRMFA